MSSIEHTPFLYNHPPFVRVISGQSDEARAIELQLIDLEGRRQLSHTLSRHPLVSEISRSALNAQHEDWDGDGAAAVNAHSVQAAKSFASCLPTWVPDPSVVIDRDGDVELYWISKDRRSSFLVVLTPAGDGRASYVSPTRRYFGTWKLEQGRLPDDFIDPLQVLASVGFEEIPQS